MAGIKMNLQQWFDEQEHYNNSTLNYANAAKAQVLWVRDNLSYLFRTFDLTCKPIVLETHTSKSVTLPVYTFKVNDVTFKIRSNFHDWCVRFDCRTRINPPDR